MLETVEERERRRQKMDIEETEALNRLRLKLFQQQDVMFVKRHFFETDKPTRLTEGRRQLIFTKYIRYVWLQKHEGTFYYRFELDGEVDGYICSLVEDETV